MMVHFSEQKGKSHRTTGGFRGVAIEGYLREPRR